MTMTQFFVNNIELLLPEDFSFTESDENPEITDKGMFTLDMTVSLLESQNAIAFEFLNRLNKSVINKTAPATKITGGVVQLGTIIIQKNSNVEVTFQFVAGNSELNYNAKSDTRKIWELDWGTIPGAITYAQALATITNPIYTNNFICPPVMLGTEIVNDFTLSDEASHFQINNNTGKLIAQPYLLYYINKLPALLGYTLITNSLNDDTRAKILYLVNAVDSLNYADFLPDITISEFIQFVEDFFHVKFLPIAKNKTLRILNFSTSVNSKKIINLDRVLDSYERDLSGSDKNINFKTLKYSFPDCDYFKYQKLKPEIFGQVTLSEFENLDLLKASANYATSNSLVIFRDLETKYDYFVNIAQNTVQPPIPLYEIFIQFRNIYLINKFSDYLNPGNSENKDLELYIVPAEIILSNKLLPITTPYTQTLKAYYQLPKSSNDYSIKRTAGIIQAIDNSVSTIKRLNVLEVSMFMGIIQIADTSLPPNVNPHTVVYPWSYVDTLPEFNFVEATLDNYNSWRDNHYIPKALKSLRLIGNDGVVVDYYNYTIIDSAKEYNFIIEDKPDRTANNLFIYNNAKYMPISFKREKSKEQTTVYGKFYRML